MSEIKVSTFANQAQLNNEENLILCTKWSYSGCKIMIFGREQPLEGELTNDLINKFASDQSKSRELYIEETKNNLNSKNQDVEFYVKNDSFKWKREIWILGSIKIQPILNIDVISKFLEVLLINFENCQNNFNDIKNDNSYLINKQQNLEEKLEQIIEEKQIMEMELYKKFLLLLNNKKKKIRELESVLKANESKNELYDTQTDDSQDLLNDFKKRKSGFRRQIIRKKIKILSDQEDSQEQIIVVSQKEVKHQITEEHLEKTSDPKEKEEMDSTTSTIFSTPKDELSVNSPSKANNITDENSDEDICLKLTGESIESEKKYENKSFIRSTIIEPESDEDLFS